MTKRGQIGHAALLATGLARGLIPAVLGLGAWAAPAAVTPGDYLIDVWTAENGLPHSSVTTIAQTPDGYLWVGTYNGLARFDGVRFVTFDPANTPALKHARIRRLYVDEQGTLWVNTYDGSLVAWRRGRFGLERLGDGLADADATLVSSSEGQVLFLLHSGELIRKPLSARLGEGWQVLRPPGQSSGALCCAGGDGTIWYRGRDQRLWRLHGETFELVPENSGLEGRAINTLVADRAGRVWIGTDREIAVWEGTRFQNRTPTNGPAAVAIGFLAVAREGDLWAVADGRVRHARGRLWTSEAETLRGMFAGNFSRMGLRQDHLDGAWLYDYGRGLFHLGADGTARQLTAEDGFPGERVDCFLEDREGNWWAGLDRGGLVRLRESRFQTLVIGDAAAPKAAVSVCEDRDGVAWVGTLGGGLSRWKDGESTNMALPGGSSRRFVFCVCPDAAGRLWASAGDEDLFVREDGRFQLVSPVVHGVKAILADHAGRIWVGTKSGLQYAEDARARNFRLHDGMPRRDVRALAEDRAGNLWVGCGDGNLYRIANGAVAAFQPPDRHLSQAIWSLLVDADDNGTVWVGTFRGGLLRFKDGQFKRFGKPDGLPDNVICQLLDDADGNLWAGSNQGIFRVAKTALRAFAAGAIKSLPCVVYGRYDGLPSLECSGGYQPAAWHGHDGRLWFATLKGVVSVDPREVRPNLLPPPVVIEEALIDGRLQDTVAAAPRSALGFGLGEPLRGVNAGYLEVPPGKRQFEFHYTGLSLVSPDRVRFRYQLEGADGDWVEAGTRRSAQYSFLRPGNYRFRVIACNNDGKWNEAGATLRLKILPHFHETWWFLSLAGVLVIGSVAGSVQFAMTRRLRREMQRLQEQRAVERERNRIAKDIHDDLGAGLTQITLLSELARRDPPSELSGHLGQISEAARELTRGMDEIVWAVDPHNDTLDSLVTYVCRFAQDYLRLARIRCRLDLPEQLPPQPLRAEVRHNLFLAVKEALNNVVKHAHATEVKLSLTCGATAFRLSIEDNGQGFAPKTPPPGTNDGTRTLPGHGLGNLERRLAAAGGSCGIRSQPGQGTRVEFAVLFENSSVSGNGDGGDVAIGQRR